MYVSPRMADILIAEKVFKKRVKYFRAIKGYEWPSGKVSIEKYPVIYEDGAVAYEDIDGVKLNLVPNYCTDYEAVMEVIQKLVEEENLNITVRKLSEKPPVFSVCLEDTNHSLYIEAISDTIPLAVVSAALKWAGVDAEISYDVEDDIK